MSADIQTGNKTHDTTCILSEGTRQGAVAAAIAAGGGSATVAAAVRTAEVNHYQRLAASAKANGLEYAQWLQAAVWRAVSP
jgi:hypothetical protein